MPARFVAAVRAQQPHAEPGYLLFDVAPCQALVGQHRGAGDNQPGLDGDGQQVQADLPLAQLRVRQAPGDGHSVGRGDQIELEALARPTSPALGTIYQCPDCEQRYLDQRRCPDCNLVCRRLDSGGLCPHCDEPVASATSPTPRRPQRPTDSNTSGGRHRADPTATTGQVR